MATSELYKPSGSWRVSSTGFTELKGEPTLLPFSPYNTELLNKLSIVVFNPKVNTERVTDGIPLSRVADMHVRSFEAPTFKAFWRDSFGTFFSTVNIKGNCLAFPQVGISEVAVNGYCVVGLLDSYSFIRTIIASEKARELGVETEAILGIIQPSELPVLDKMMPIGDFKKKLLDIVWRINAKKHTKIPAVSFKRPKREEIGEINKWLEGANFYFAIRAMPVDERIQDFIKVETKDDLDLILKNVFAFINLKEEQKGSGEHFDINNQKDVLRYFSKYLPTQLGINIGRLHKGGYIHKYLHSGNLLASGGICDLDSMRGEGLGFGDKIPVKSYLEEAVVSIGFYKEDSEVITEIVHLQSKGLLPKGRRLLNTFRNNYYDAYLREAQDVPFMDIVEGLRSVMGRRFTKDSTPIFKRIYEILRENYGFDYSFEGKFEDVWNDFDPKDFEASVSWVMDKFKEKNEVTAEEIKIFLDAVKPAKYFDTSFLPTSRERFNIFLYDIIYEDFLKKSARNIAKLNKTVGLYGYFLLPYYADYEAVKFLEPVSESWFEKLEENRDERIGQVINVVLERRNARERYF